MRRKKNDETGKNSLLNIIDKIFYYDYVANINLTQEEMFQHCAKRISDNSIPLLPKINQNIKISNNL